MWRGLNLFPDEIADEAYGLFQSEQRRVDAEVIALAVSPAFARIELIVGTALGFSWWGAFLGC